MIYPKCAKKTETNIFHSFKPFNKFATPHTEMIGSSLTNFQSASFFYIQFILSAYRIQPRHYVHMYIHSIVILIGTQFYELF